MSPGEEHFPPFNFIHSLSIMFTNRQHGFIYRLVPRTYSMPDYSKVKPKVRLPKGNNMPPVSRRSSRRESLSSHVMYMSTADIVREVLLNRSPDPSAPNCHLPQDFRSRQEVISLVQQLQVPTMILTRPPSS